MESGQIPYDKKLVTDDNNSNDREQVMDNGPKMSLINNIAVKNDGDQSSDIGKSHLEALRILDRLLDKMST